VKIFVQRQREGYAVWYRQVTFKSFFAGLTKKFDHYPSTAPKIISQIAMTIITISWSV